MADAPPATKAGSGITRKVGPLPLWAWVGIGFGVYYWYTHYGPGSGGSAAQAGQPATSDQTGSALLGNISQRIGNITAGGGAGGGGSTGGGDGKPKRHQKCPPGMFWDQDDNDGKGRCVPNSGKGPDRGNHDRSGRGRKAQPARRDRSGQGGGGDIDGKGKGGKGGTGGTATPGGPATVNAPQNVSIENTPYGAYPYGAYAAEAPGAATQGGPVVATTQGNPLYQSWDPNSPYTAPLSQGTDAGGTSFAFAPQTAGAIHQGSNGSQVIPDTGADTGAADDGSVTASG